MALVRWQATITDEAGDVQSGATVTIRNKSGGLVTVYVDIDGITPAGNPFTADGNGYAFGYIAAGSYDISATKGAFSITWTDVIGSNSELFYPTLAEFKAASLFVGATARVKGRPAYYEVVASTARTLDDGAAFALAGGLFAEARFEGNSAYVDQWGVLSGLGDQSLAIEAASLVVDVLRFRESSLPYNIGTLNINRGCWLVGDKAPSVDFTTKTFNGDGVQLLGQIFSNGADGFGLFNLGVDSTSASLVEGVVINNATNLSIDRVTVLGSNENNHCMLIEGADNIDVNRVTSVGGKQGLAVKATNFNIRNIISVDCVTWGLTLRYSPGFPCTDGTVDNVRTYPVANATAGGVILMNNESGAAAKNIHFSNLDVSNGFLYLDNSGNATAATNITHHNVIMRNSAGYAIQTFGSPTGCKWEDCTFDNCTQPFYTNGGSPSSLVLGDFHILSGGATALLEGSNHTAFGWTRVAGGGFFIDNRSTDLRYYGMQPDVSIVNNSPGTAQLADYVPGSIKIAQAGSFPAVVKKLGRTKKFNIVGATNPTATTIYTCATTLRHAELEINTISVGGIKMARVVISGSKVTVVSEDTNFSLIWSVTKSGQDIVLTYIFGTPGDVGVSCHFDIVEDQ